MKDLPQEVEDLLAHLDEFPLGCRDGKVIQARSTTEATVVEWIITFYDLQKLVRNRHETCPGCRADEATVITKSLGRHEHYRRASGEMPCEVCTKLYRQHPHSEHRDWQDEPWLVRLCNGELVKL